MGHLSRAPFIRFLLLCAFVLGAGCSDTPAEGDTGAADAELDHTADGPSDSSADDDASVADDASDAVDVDSGDPAEEEEEVIPWGTGELEVSGRAYFFDMETPGQLSWVRDVEGAEVYVFEAPELRVTLDSADDHTFRFEGIPQDVEVTLALTHTDYFPSLTATLAVGEEGLEGITFQVVSRRIGDLVGTLLGVDPNDPSTCQMATTVSAAGADSIWAVGEPGATVTLDPSVPSQQGPFYFNTYVLPDRTLSETTTDGGVIVVGVEPGEYIWSGHKDGVTFTDLKMRCVGGWATNASPPYGMNVLPSE